MSRRELLTLAEAAEYAAVSERSIRRYIASGRLIAYRAGPRLIRIDRAELDAMLQPIPSARVLRSPGRS
jgi:excisionase family DNA binding protein